MVPSKKFEQLESTSADAKMILIAKGEDQMGLLFSIPFAVTAGRKFSTY